MFDWLLNTPLSLDGYYLNGLSNLYVRIVVPEFFQKCSFKSTMWFKVVGLRSFYLWDSKLFFLS